MENLKTEVRKSGKPEATFLPSLNSPIYRQRGKPLTALTYNHLQLGLDNVTSGHHGQQQQGINGFVNGNPNGGTVIDGKILSEIFLIHFLHCLGPTTNEGIWNTYSTNYSSMTTLPHDQPSQYQNNGLSSPPAKAKREPLRVLGGGVMAEKVATSPNTNGVCLFNSPHHRRF